MKLTNHQKAGRKSAMLIKERYGEDFFRRNGALGGKASNTGGFTKGSEAAKAAGRKGGLATWRKLK